MAVVYMKAHTFPVPAGPIIGGVFGGVAVAALLVGVLALVVIVLFRICRRTAVPGMCAHAFNVH